jgi:hypothetical protein
MIESNTDELKVSIGEMIQASVRRTTNLKPMGRGVGIFRKLTPLTSVIPRRARNRVFPLKKWGFWNE